MARVIDVHNLVDVPLVAVDVGGEVKVPAAGVEVPMRPRTTNAELSELARRGGL